MHILPVMVWVEVPHDWHGDEEVVKFLAELMKFSAVLLDQSLYQLFVLIYDFEVQCFMLIILGFSVYGDCCWIVPGFTHWPELRHKIDIGVLLEKILNMYLL